jgi:hypothetical protein
MLEQKSAKEPLRSSSKTIPHFHSESQDKECFKRATDWEIER